jgi:putative transposase
MAHYQITLDSTTLHQLFLGGSADSSMKPVLESVLNQVLQAQATEQVAAGPYERKEERQDFRNGFYPRTLQTRVGTLTLQIPRLRSGRFSTELFVRYQRSEQALMLSLMEMVIQGVSTRKVTEVTQELCGAEFSKSTVSALCKRLDPIVTAWNARPLRDTHYPFVLVDAIVIKIREEIQVRPRGVMIATGITAEGQREILGFHIDDSESEASWSEFFDRLKQRGLSGVDLIVSDCHGGLVRAIRTHFQGVLWQRCQTHFLRNILDATPKSLQRELHARLQSLLHADKIENARPLLQSVLADFTKKAPKAMNVLEEGFEAAVAVMVLPEAYHQRLRTTNSVERLNEEIRRRERVIRIFPNPESAHRLLGTLLMEHSDKWLSGKRYLCMDEYHAWRSIAGAPTTRVVRIM